MEKYSKWTDKSTGINPFVPFGQYSIQLPRLILLFPVVLLRYFIFSILLKMVSLASGFLSRCILWVLGVWKIQETNWNASTERQMFENQISGASSSKKNDAAAVRFIISNHVSYLDCFYYAWKYPNCQFLAMYVDELHRDVKLRPMRLLEYLQHQFWNHTKDLLQYRKVKDAYTMTQFVKQLRTEIDGQQKKTYVFFFEGTTTNGRGLLGFPGKESDLNLLGDLIEVKHGAKKVNVELVALNYEIGSRKNTDMSYNAAFHMENFTGHVLGLCSQFYTPLEVRRLHLGKHLFENQMINAKKYIAGVLTGVQALGNLSLVDKKDFMKYWDRTQGNY